MSLYVYTQVDDINVEITDLQVICYVDTSNKFNEHDIIINFIFYFELGLFHYSSV